MTAIVPPAGIDGEAVVRAYGAEDNITIAGGQGEMKGKLFRLAHLGWVDESDLIVGLASLERVLARLGVPVEFGAAVGRRAADLRQGKLTARAAARRSRDIGSGPGRADLGPRARLAASAVVESLDPPRAAVACPAAAESHLSSGPRTMVERESPERSSRA